MKKFNLFLLTSLIVGSCSGCVTGAILTVGGAAAVVASDSRSMDEMQQDNYIKYQVDKALNSDAMLNKAHIIVEAYNCKVVLIGEVQSPELKEMASEIALTVPKVKKVFNKLTVGENSSLAQKTKDSWITSQAKTVLLGTPKLKSLKIKIVTENRVVYLIGSLSHADTRLATLAITNKIKDVRKVVLAIDYTD